MSSIPLPALDVNPPQAQPGPLDQYGQLVKLKSMLAGGQLQQQQLQAAQMENEERKSDLEDQKKFRQAFVDSNGNLEQAIAAVAKKGVSPKLLIGAKSALVEQQKKTADLVKTQGENAATQADIMKGAHDAVDKAPAASKPTVYKQQLAGLQQAGMDISQLPPEYPGDDTFKYIGAAVTGHKQQIDDALKQQQAQEAASLQQLHQAELPGKVAESGIAPQKSAAELLKAQAEASSAGQKARLGVGGVAAAEAAGKIRGEMGAMGGIGGVGGPPNPNLQPGQRDESYLASLNGNVKSTVKAIAEGRMPIPAGFALKSPYWQNMLAMVSKYDPSFDAVNYNARSQTRKSATSGPIAAQSNALNTVIGHLESLSTAADALGNRWSPTWNSVANAFETAKGDPRVKKFEVTKNAVGDELTRVWRQAGGSEADIQSWQKQLSAAGSPEQLHGAIAQIGELLNSKLDSMQAQVTQGMGTSEIKLLTPKAQQTLQKLTQKATGGQAETRTYQGALYTKQPDGTWKKE